MTTETLDESWIPVSKKMPDVEWVCSKDLKILTKKKGIKTGYYFHGFGYKHWTCTDGTQLTTRQIKAWKPL